VDRVSITHSGDTSVEGGVQCVKFGSLAAPPPPGRSLGDTIYIGSPCWYVEPRILSNCVVMRTRLSSLRMPSGPPLRKPPGSTTRKRRKPAATVTGTSKGDPDGRSDGGEDADGSLEGTAEG
jgi:hypothetical protein